MMHYTKSFLVLLILVMIALPINSVNATTWSDGKNLTEEDSHQMMPRIAMNGDTVHVVWEDNEQGSKSIIYKRSTDNGSTWGQAVKLTDNIANQQDPDIAVYEHNVYVVWEDQRNSATTGSDIYIMRSEDDGISWKNEEQLTTNEANQWNPRIAVFDEYVHLTWLDERNMATANYDIYYRRSISSGRTWDNEQRLTSDPSIQWKQSIDACGKLVYIVYEDYREWHYPPGGSKGIIIYYARSLDGGESWSTDNRLPTDGVWQLYPDVAVNEKYVFITWTDFRSFFESWLDIWFIAGTHEGIWSNDTRITNDSKIQEYPRIAAYGEQVHIIWQDLRNEPTSGTDLYYMKVGCKWLPCCNYSINLETPIRLTESKWQYDQAIAASKDQVHIVWTEEELLEMKGQEIFYQRGTN